MAIVFENAKKILLLLLLFNSIWHITLLKLKVRNAIEVKVKKIES
jgi:hypothetical protein